MNYKNFILDKFQEDSIHCIEKNHSVVVSAATGTGKTLIADYVIDKFLKENKRVIYTAPIKALSNQKYKDFKADYGADRVGILTGDVSINPHAQILIMTTEIYRNMLLSNDPITEGLRYIVFDEIHFISDIERGTIWEESIIFSPAHVRFLCLSATIPNAKQFASWIESIKKHTVDVVTYEKRAVPLDHFLFDQELGVVRAKEVKERKNMDKNNNYYKLYRKKFRNKSPSLPPQHIDLIRILKREQKLPCIFFVFSRMGTEKKAMELHKAIDFLTQEEKREVISISTNYFNDDIKNMDSTRLLKQVLSKGVGIHHAGLLPAQKELVEELFSKNLIKVLYATETFAVGINYPARTVCFNSVDKYDGVNFRYLNSKEYFQMAGRAGRRGIDSKGYAIAMVDRHFADVDKIIQISDKDVDPIISQFKLSINTILNMIRNHTDNEIQIILKSNFDYYVRQTSDKQVRILSSWNSRVKKLKAMGYITDGKLDGHSFAITPKGEFATHIYSNELLLTELFCNDFYHKVSPIEINLLIAGIAYEFKPANKFKHLHDRRAFDDLVRKISNNNFAYKNINRKVIYDLMTVVFRWCNGCEFAELLEYANLQEGDFIRLFRQMTDILSQLKRATTDLAFEEKLVNCINLIYRDVVKVEFS